MRNIVVASQESVGHRLVPERRIFRHIFQLSSRIFQLPEQDVSLGCIRTRTRNIRKLTGSSPPVDALHLAAVFAQIYDQEASLVCALMRQHHSCSETLAGEKISRLAPLAQRATRLTLIPVRIFNNTPITAFIGPPATGTPSAIGNANSRATVVKS